MELRMNDGRHMIARGLRTFIQNRRDPIRTVITYHWLFQIHCGAARYTVEQSDSITRHESRQCKVERTDDTWIGCDWCVKVNHATPRCHMHSTTVPFQLQLRIFHVYSIWALATAFEALVDRRDPRGVRYPGIGGSPLWQNGHNYEPPILLGSSLDPANHAPSEYLELALWACSGCRSRGTDCGDLLPPPLPTGVWYHSGVPVVPIRWVVLRDPKA
jgi:hypothetical protein